MNNFISNLISSKKYLSFCKENYISIFSEAMAFNTKVINFSKDERNLVLELEKDFNFYLAPFVPYLVVYKEQPYIVIYSDILIEKEKSTFMYFRLVSEEIIKNAQTSNREAD